MDRSRIKGAANSFWLAASRNFEKRWTNPRQFQMLLVPGVVCSAFSIELGLKAILFDSGNPPRTHDLSKLFDLLPTATQDQIVAGCGKPRDEFNTSLLAIANLFEEWRYVYEVDELSLDNEFLQKFSNAVKFVVDSSIT